MKNSKARELAKAATEADPRWSRVMEIGRAHV